MTFAAPACLWGLVLLPVAVAAYAAAQRRRARYAVRFTNLDLLANLVPHTPGWRRHAPPALYLAALAALLVALARPQAPVLMAREQATVVLVVDVSGSMNATDVQPSRLAAAKTASHRFLNGLPSIFRVALISFSSGVQVVTPPTTDRTAIGRDLDRLQAGGGTAMGDAIERALVVAQAARQVASPPPTPTPTPTPSTLSAPAVSLPVGPSRNGQPPQPARPLQSSRAAGHLPAVILLLSDGASTAGQVQPLDAAAHARQLDIPVYTIVLGTSGGSFEALDSSGTRRRFPAPPDEATLRQIADATGGEHFAAPTAAALQAVYGQIGSLISLEREWQEVTWAFSALAAGLLIAGGALALRWFNRFP